MNDILAEGGNSTALRNQFNELAKRENPEALETDTSFVRTGVVWVP